MKILQIPTKKYCYHILFIVAFLFLLPIAPNGELSETHAFKNVWVRGGPGTTADKQSARANAESAALQRTLLEKEFNFDGIASQLAKQIVQNMTQSIVTWINSGFEGSPAFVTDLKGFLLDAADQTAGDFIYNNPDLNFLCSPFQLDVKIALAVAYQQHAHGGFSEAQCTLSDVTDNIEGFLNGDFSAGGWDSWLEITQNPVNTPTGAYLAAEGEMYARIVDEQGRTIRELDWGNGFLSFKVCSDTDVASGKAKDCDITTPGTVIANQLNKSLGAGQDALITADEINEIIGALFAQLAQQAITGVNGLLGLGGSSYSNNSFGDGSDSFLDALNEDKAETTNSTNPIDNALQNEQKNLILQNKIVRDVNLVEEKITVSTDAQGSCFGVRLPDSLNEKRQEAVNKILTSQNAITVLTALKTQYENTNDPQEKLRILNELQQLKNNNTLISESDISTLELYIEFDFKDEIVAVEAQINTAINQCNRDGDD